MSIFSTGGNLGMATGPLVITPLVLAYGLRASLVPLFPILLIAGFLVTQLPILAALHPSAPARSGAAAPVPDRWGPFGRLAVVVVTRSVVYTGLATFLPLVFVGSSGRRRREGPRRCRSSSAPASSGRSPGDGSRTATGGGSSSSPG